MKRLSIVIFSLLVALSGILASAAQPRMIFESTEIDLGDIDAGNAVELKFKFKNTGDEMLVINSISSSCGCTVPKLEKKEYKPGEAGVIPVKFDSRGLSGKIAKTITITTNQQDNAYTTLKIKGTVTLKDFASAIVDPNQLDFKTVKVGKEYSQTIKIESSGTIDLQVIEVAHSPQVCLLFPKDVVPPRKIMDVKVVFTPTQTGQFATFIRIRTNAYQQSFAIVKLIAVVEE